MKSAKEEAFTAHRSGDLAKAERLYRELLRAKPSDAELHHYLGVLCLQDGRAAESAESLREALALAPGSALTLQLLARACDQMGDTEEALVVLDQYLSHCPNDAEMHNVRGQLLMRLGRLQNAAQAFGRAADLTGNAAMFHDLGLQHQLLGNPSAAASAYAEAIRRGHDLAKTRLLLAQCLRATGQTGRYYEVATSAARANPDDIGLLIEAQSARRYVCDWDGFGRHQQQLALVLNRAHQTNSKLLITPGILNFLDVGEQVIATIARRYASQLSQASKSLQKKLRTRRPVKKTSKIRLGYISTDFFAHAVGFIVRDLFVHHDRSRFEVYGYSLRHQPDPVQTHIRQGFDTYRNLSGASAEEIARSIFTDEIDILIDLAGYTSAAKPAALAARPAPVQISWLGYLGTSGSIFIDYIIADDIALPPGLAKYYTEQVIRLPCFLVGSPLPMDAQRLERADAGLSNEDFVFCSFNQPYKLDLSTFATWMEILRKVPQGKLWIYAPDSTVCGKNLRREAARLGIDRKRLVFAKKLPMAKHMARIQLADLSLDPFHISGGATNLANVTAGVPILTLRGDSFLGRMGSSINTRLGMSDLDCAEAQQYVKKAVELATTPTSLIEVKNRLGAAKHTSELFNIRNFTTILEKGLQSAWDRHTAGLPTAEIKVTE
jgi:protein O-GlcNAc transferase